MSDYALLPPKKDPSAIKIIIICKIFLFIIEFNLGIVNGCQIGMSEASFPDSFMTDQEVTIQEEERKDQMAMLAVQIVAHMLLTCVGATKLFKGNN
jgi:hypothetical protein